MHHVPLKNKKQILPEIIIDYHKTKILRNQRITGEQPKIKQELLGVNDNVRRISELMF